MSSSSDAVIYMLGHSAVAKTGATGWQAIQPAALKARQEGAGKGGSNRAAQTRTVGMAQPIATHSHECVEPLCRRPVKLASHFTKGKWYFYLEHRCPVTGGKVKGWGKYICRTCHQSARVCKDTVCKYSKCCGAKAVCAHLHDGSVLTELRK